MLDVYLFRQLERKCRKHRVGTYVTERLSPLGRQNGNESGFSNLVEDVRPFQKQEDAPFWSFYINIFNLSLLI